MNKEEKEAIEYLKEIADLKMQNHIIKDMNLTVRRSEEVFNDLYISKDKIREKIKEIETLSMLDFVEKEKFDFEYSLDGIYCMQKGVVFILKELLGE